MDPDTVAFILKHCQWGGTSGPLVLERVHTRDLSSVLKGAVHSEVVEEITVIPEDDRRSTVEIVLNSYNKEEIVEKSE